MVLAQELQFARVISGNRSRAIAVRVTEGSGPTIVWLCGYQSSMVSLKASALSRWASECGYRLVRFDYSGTGESSGRFEDGTISDWLEDTLAVVEKFTAGPVILAGSSLGAWVALLAARRLASASPERTPKGLVLVGAAPDFTENLLWNRISDDVREILLRDRQWSRVLPGGDTQIFTMRLIEDARNHLVMSGSFPTPAPVHVIHGMDDNEISWRYVMQLVDCLEGKEVAVTLIKSADHVLHDDSDLNFVFDIIGSMARR